MIDLSATRIIVTGGTSGIGKACVAGFSAAGARVISMDVDPRADEAAAELRASGEDCRYLRCDVSSSDSVHAAFETAGGLLGGLDVLVCLAGVGSRVAAAEITEALMRRLMDIHFMGTFFCNQAARELMTAGGRIINTGSLAGIRGLPGHAHYGAAKGAIMAWTRSAALEWGALGISVNAIAPVAMTPMVEESIAAAPAEMRDAYIAAVNAGSPLGRGMLSPEEGVLPLMLFLASPGSAYITGQTISVDGGIALLGS